MTLTSPVHGQLVLDALLRQSLTSFVARVFRELEPQHVYVASDHVDILADRLERMSEGEMQRLIINLPPRHLKSTVTSVAFVAWMLGRNPSLRFVLVSYGADLVLKHMRQVRHILGTAWYRRLFPGTRIAGRNTQFEFETSRRGSVYTTTIEGALTGRGGDYFIVDDPMKAMDASFEGRLQSVNNWVSDTLLSRLDDKTTGRVILVMQRLHVNDLTGHLLENGLWELLCLSAIAEERQAFLLRNGRRIIRSPGDVLYAREPRKELDRIRLEMGHVAFSAQYQQAPEPQEGLELRSEWLTFHDEQPEPHPYDRVVQAWDLASKAGPANDYSAGVTVRYSFRDKRLYVLDIWRGKLLYPQLRRKVIGLANKYKPGSLIVEDAGLGPALIVELRAAGVPGVRGVKPSQSKPDRITAMSSAFEAGRVSLPRLAPWLGPFEREFRAFPLGRNDDMLDAMAYALNAALKVLATPDMVYSGPYTGRFPREVV